MEKLLTEIGLSLVGRAKETNEIGGAAVKCRQFSDLGAATFLPSQIKLLEILGK